jgi:glycosyltransferase involved in cell wall biosynthesis
MPIKVSVVVPVFNPGEHIADSVESLLAQTMPADELELIFVDDGSTDDTPALLDRLAEEHPQIRVFHEPPSGWPGRPRNVGLEAAVGEYVQFVDQDDWLGDEALTRLYAMARRNESDIVIGKMIGINRNVPVLLFGKSWDNATIHNSPIIDSLTPHKMFRREFLLESGLRFPEGPRRLEDHVFVVAAYFAAERISVLSDYACYFHISRGDHGNAGLRQVEPRGYMANIAEALDIVDKFTEPGPARDRLHRRWMRVEILGRLRGARFLGEPPDYREEFVRAARSLVNDRFAPGVDAGLSPIEHLVAWILRNGDLAALVEVADWESKLRVQARLQSARWDAGNLVLDVAGTLVDGAGKPVVLQAGAGSRVLTPPLPPHVVEALPPDLLEVGNRGISLDLFARHLDTGTVQFLPGSSAAEEGQRLSASSTSRIPTSSRLGDVEPLADGIWEICARWRAFGMTFSPRVNVQGQAPAGEDPVGGPALVGDLPRLARPHRTVGGNLRVELTGTSPAIPRTVPKLRVDRGRSTASAEDHELELDVSLHLETDRSRRVMVHVGRGGSENSHVWPALLDPVRSDDPGPATCRLSTIGGQKPLATGRWKLRLSPDNVAYRLPLACDLLVRKGGAMRLGRNPAYSYRARVLSLLPPALPRLARAARHREPVRYRARLRRLLPNRLRRLLPHRLRRLLPHRLRRG